VKYFSEILQVCEPWVDILFIKIQSRYSVCPDRIQSQVAILAYLLFVAHMESHILGRHSAFLLTCCSLREMKVDPFIFRIKFLRRVGSPDWVETYGDISGPVYVDEK